MKLLEDIPKLYDTMKAVEKKEGGDWKDQLGLIKDKLSLITQLVDKTKLGSTKGGKVFTVLGKMSDTVLSINAALNEYETFDILSKATNAEFGLSNTELGLFKLKAIHKATVGVMTTVDTAAEVASVFGMGDIAGQIGNIAGVIKTTADIMIGDDRVDKHYFKNMNDTVEAEAKLATNMLKEVQGTASQIGQFVGYKYYKQGIGDVKVEEADDIAAAEEQKKKDEKDKKALAKKVKAKTEADQITRQESTARRIEIELKADTEFSEEYLKSLAENGDLSIEDAFKLIDLKRKIKSKQSTKEKLAIIKKKYDLKKATAKALDRKHRNGKSTNEMLRKLEALENELIEISLNPSSLESDREKTAKIIEQFQEIVGPLSSGSYNVLRAAGLSPSEAREISLAINTKVRYIKDQNVLAQDNIYQRNVEMKDEFAQAKLRKEKDETAKEVRKQEEEIENAETERAKQDAVAKAEAKQADIKRENEEFIDYVANDLGRYSEEELNQFYSEGRINQYQLSEFIQTKEDMSLSNAEQLLISKNEVVTPERIQQMADLINSKEGNTYQAFNAFRAQTWFDVDILTNNQWSQINTLDVGQTERAFYLENLSDEQKEQYEAYLEVFNVRKEEMTILFEKKMKELGLNISIEEFFIGSGSDLDGWISKSFAGVHFTDGSKWDPKQIYDSTRSDELFTKELQNRMDNMDWTAFGEKYYFDMDAIDQMIYDQQKTDEVTEDAASDFNTQTKIDTATTSSAATTADLATRADDVHKGYWGGTYVTSANSNHSGTFDGRIYTTDQPGRDGTVTYYGFENGNDLTRSEYDQDPTDYFGDYSYTAISAWTATATETAVAGTLGYGYWAVGTPTTTMPSTGTATYSGEIQGYIGGGALTGISAATGTVSMNMDFSDQQLTGSMVVNRTYNSVDQGTWASGNFGALTVDSEGKYSGEITGSGIVNTDTWTSEIKGRFTGPNAEETAGRWNIENSSGEKGMGAYRAKQ
jgi:hypothetical protein